MPTLGLITVMTERTERSEGHEGMTRTAPS
jgi:hypothetical protein